MGLSLTAEVVPVHPVLQHSDLDPGSADLLDSADPADLLDPADPDFDRTFADSDHHPGLVYPGSDRTVAAVAVVAVVAAVAVVVAVVAVASSDALWHKYNFHDTINPKLVRRRKKYMSFKKKGLLIWGVLILIVAIIAGSGFYHVEEGCEGLVLTFGKITVTSVACALILGILTKLVLSRGKEE